MVTAPTTCSRSTELESAIERRILERTWGRVHQLRVVIDGDRVTIGGCSPSYYVLQLALQAVREVCPAASIDLDIQVGVDPPRVSV